MDKIKKRFEQKYVINKETKCWDWIAYIRPDGYGGFSINLKEKTAHRVSYELYVDKINSSMVLDHLCRNRACVNPQHLEVVTRAENNRRGLRTHKICKHGIGYSQCKEECGKEYRARKARERHAANPDKRNKYMIEYNKLKSGKI